MMGRVERDSRMWLKGLCNQHNLPGPARAMLMRRWERIRFKDGTRTANARIRETLPYLVAVLGRYPMLTPAMFESEAERKRVAADVSLECLQMLEAAEGRDYGQKVASAFRLLSNIAERHHITLPPVPEDCTGAELEKWYERMCLRLVCTDWWKNVFSRMARMADEHLRIASGEVTRYCSDNALKRHRNREELTQNWLAQMEAVSDDGDALSLLAVSSKGIANLENRRIELIVRTAGMEKAATQRGHVGWFLTFTTPSRFHKNSARWDGSSPRDSHDWLVTTWARIRARLKDAELDYSGVRVVEAHKDGTAHWHMVVWCSRGGQSTLRRICRGQSLRENGTEPGARIRRFTAERIDPKKGGAVAYILKYICKNLNGAHMHQQQADDTPTEFDPKPTSGGDVATFETVRTEDGTPVFDETGQPLVRMVDGSALRVRAWASLWGVRQFQAFGTGSVTIWRELRRLGKGDAGRVDNPTIEAARRAATDNKWDAFCSAAQSLSLVSEITPEGGRYADDTRKVIGVKAGRVMVCTRPKKWALALKGAARQREAEGRPPWSPMNNCTGASPDREIELLGLGPEARHWLEQGRFVTPKLGEKIYIYRNGNIWEADDDELRKPH